MFRRFENNPEHKFLIRFVKTYDRYTKEIGTVHLTGYKGDHATTIVISVLIQPKLIHHDIIGPGTKTYWEQTDV